MHARDEKRRREGCFRPVAGKETPEGGKSTGLGRGREAAGLVVPRRIRRRSATLNSRGKLYPGVSSRRATGEEMSRVSSLAPPHHSWFSSALRMEHRKITRSCPTITTEASLDFGEICIYVFGWPRGFYYRTVSTAILRNHRRYEEGLYTYIYIFFLLNIKSGIDSAK